MNQHGKIATRSRTVTASTIIAHRCSVRQSLDEPSQSRRVHSMWIGARCTGTSRTSTTGVTSLAATAKTAYPNKLKRAPETGAFFILQKGIMKDVKTALDLVASIATLDWMGRNRNGSARFFLSLHAAGALHVGHRQGCLPAWPKGPYVRIHARGPQRLARCRRIEPATSLTARHHSPRGKTETRTGQTVLSPCPDDTAPFRVPEKVLSVFDVVRTAPGGSQFSDKLGVIAKPSGTTATNTLVESFVSSMATAKCSSMQAANDPSRNHT